MVALHQTVADLHLVHIAGQQGAGAQIHQLADDVRAGQVDIVFALPLGQTHMQVAGLGIHQERGERVSIAQEQNVRQRDVTPVETGEVQTHHQHSQGVDQPFGRIRAQVAGEQGAIRQRELQMPGDQDRLQRLAFTGMTTRHHGDRLDGGQFELLQTTQQLVLALGDVAGDLLHGIHGIADVHETHDVAGNASGQIGEQFVRPGRQRLLPRQGKHLRVRARGGDFQRLRLRRRRGGRVGLHRRGLEHTRIHLRQISQFHKF